MRNHTILLGLLASVTAAACTTIECAEGTIERDGKCDPDNSAVGSATCGDFTHIEGDRCVPDFPPVVCEGGMVEDDPNNPGVKICKGGGDSPDCAVPLNCSTPAGATKQTICGQIYDFENPGQKFQASMDLAMGSPCDPNAPTTSGPCALQIVPYDALAFGMAPTTTPPLTAGDVTIDECGRFRVKDIETNGTSPFIGLGIDDAGGPVGNPAGVTVTTAVATPKLGMSATKNLEAFIVKGSTIAAWQASGGPPLSGGIYAPVFRAHRLPVTTGTAFDPQPGVTVTKSGNPVPNNDFYFRAADVPRTMIDINATATGANGTALITAASVMDSVAWGGSGGLGAGCRWEPHAGASLAGIVFIQVFRKTDLVGQTCND